jgi:hypothetical protein
MAVAEPFRKFVFPDQRGMLCECRPEGAVPEIGGVFRFAMLTGIQIDVFHEIFEYAVTPDFDPFQFELEYFTRPGILLIIPFGIRIKQDCKGFVRITVCIIPDFNEEVKVVMQQAVCIGFGHRDHMGFVKFQEEFTIILVDE